MSNFEKLVQIGRKLGGARGGEIQLENNTAYLTNTKRSSLYKFKFNESLGTGGFYASQVLLRSEQIERRGDKVWFQWKEGNIIRREFVPNLDDFSKEMEKAFKDFSDKQIVIPKNIFDVLTDKFLVTKIKIKDDKIITKQVRSDGDVGFENEIPLSRGLTEVKHPDTEELSIFSSDLLVLKPLVETEVKLGFEKGKPLSVSIPFDGGSVQALIGSLIYE